MPSTSTFATETDPTTFTIQLQRPRDSAEGRPTPDRSRSHSFNGLQVPNWDVFSGWTVTALEDDPDGNYSQPTCTGWWKQKFPGWVLPSSRPWDFHPRHDVGDWALEVSVNQLPPNFPEWIAPPASLQ
ncbi:hypothetical protein GS4_23_00140 [Gordonia soli NBRC 108243]|uniref:Uncharacterized protein n=1 Tax=Gordonia soli NBRC 108243 TaxID=1223545 RepID=M0QKQ3_9ACTN|nr:hypothetical protein GS4_23_00140 [Gordonia soli NBRC 108243]